MLSFKRVLLVLLLCGQGATGKLIPRGIGLAVPGNSVPTTVSNLWKKPTPVTPVSVSTESPPTQESQGASVPVEIFNLVKSIVGAGVLGLPADLVLCVALVGIPLTDYAYQKTTGIAAFGSTSTALIPAVTLMSLAGILSAYGFSLIGRVCAYTGANSYRDAWARSVSPKTAWIPAAACFMVTSCSVLAYSMILCVTIPSLTNSFLGVSISRTEALLGVTIFALLPLCLMKSLKSLGPFSLVGICGMLYTSVAMFLRWLDGSYVAGPLLQSLEPHLLPKLGASGDETLLELLGNPNIFLLISMLSTAYMAHYNAPKFYLELENNTIPRFNFVVGVSFLISFGLFVSIAAFGFLTFGKSSAGLVLNNYATQDQLMAVSRVAVALSLLFSYPLAFGGVRDGLLDLLQVSHRPNSFLNAVTVGLLTIITGMAYTLTDLRKLLAFNGATWGNAVIYLLPTYMVINLARTSKPELKKEIPQALTTAMIGIGMGLVGTAIALNS
eukprot:Nitzschia sp. Nitz4//scaffold12_size214221//94322//95837//NITZ4_001501-RA/size214221-processed-gene-0.347-mRNA-1//-1//CDS//3329535023//2824//frame0